MAKKGDDIEPSREEVEAKMRRTFYRALDELDAAEDDKAVLSAARRARAVITVYKAFKLVMPKPPEQDQEKDDSLREYKGRPTTLEGLRAYTEQKLDRLIEQRRDHGARTRDERGGTARTP